LTSHAEVAVANTEKQTITHFEDLDPGYSAVIGSQPDETFDSIETADADLSKFLSRPVRVFSTRWSSTAPNGINGKFNPWKLFCENPAVNEKIKYYNNISGTLHLKFLINGNSFTMGRVMVSYNPVKFQDKLDLANAFTHDYVLLSQRPHILLNPTTNEGGEMKLPFFYYFNYMNIPRKEWDDMGEILISNLNSLFHASGEDVSVSITAYAFMTDVKLTTPTALLSQSLLESHSKKKKHTTSVKKDEYGTGIVSKPASVVAAAAGWLKNVPVVGPYARATEMVASGVGDVAKLFGYSRPNDITGVKAVKPVLGSAFATTDQTDLAVKLTLDSKQECTIDSRTVGLDGDDQMSIYDIAQRESLLTQFDWRTFELGDLPGDVLARFNVTPSICNEMLNGQELFMPPMCFMSQMFNYWHGSIIYRFQVVASQFHKGRLRIQYDPNISTSTDENKQFTEIIDIAETRDFEVKVGWGTGYPFLEIGKAGEINGTIYKQYRIGHDSLPMTYAKCNGQLQVSVLNELIVPGTPATAPRIQVNVYVKADSDMKFAVPRSDLIQNLSIAPLVSQSMFEPLESHNEVTTDATTDHGSHENKPGETQQISLNPGDSDTDTILGILFGEHVVSLRQLFKRYAFHTAWRLPAVASGALRTNTIRNKVMPFYRLAYNTPIGVYNYASGPTAYSVNPCPTIPLTYCMPAFAGYRGGFRRKYVCNAEFQGNTRCMIAHREPYDDEVPLVSSTSYTTPVDFTLSINSPFTDSANGSEIQLLRNNCCMEVEYPYYQTERFKSTRVINVSQMQSEQSELTVMVNPAANESGDKYVLDYVSPAEDFTLFFFVNVPKMYRWDMPLAM